MKRNIFTVASDRITRKALYKFPKLRKHCYILSEYPKSGGTWVGQVFSDYMNIPFPRNRRPNNLNSLLHNHELPSNINFSSVCKKPLVVYRDPRDIVVSYYYHSYFVNELFNERHTERMKKKSSFKNYDDIKNNLPEFINLIFKEKFILNFNWIDFVSEWSDVPHVKIKYENMLENPFNEMSKAISFYTNSVDESRLLKIIEKYSLKNQKTLVNLTKLLLIL